MCQRVQVTLAALSLLTLLAAPVFVATMCAPTFKVWVTVAVPSTVVALEAAPMLTGPFPMVVVPVVVA